MFNLKTKQPIIVTNSSKSAAKPTSVAATVVPEDVEEGRKNKRIVIYFIGDDQYLYSANCVPGDSTSFSQSAEKPLTVGKGYTVRQFSQLSIYHTLIRLTSEPSSTA
ncbi:putative Fucose-specific lectin [Seiridium cardinale]|uniref:Fucose-specific lectin n=1 Tax=Seiridium cardinale TaxID=138064 RepID=A0ABR2XFQ5_9PEZI